MAVNVERPKKGCSMADAGLTAEQALEKIAGHIAGKIPVTAPHFQPYIKQEGIAFSAPQGFIHVDLGKFYPQARVGEAAFTVCRVRVPENSPIGLLVNGRVKVWYNGKCVFSSLSGEGWGENGYEVELIDAVKHVTGVDTAWYSVIQLERDGENELMIESVCGEEGFAFDLNLSHTKNLTVWATDYLIWVREESPLPELAGEEGIAVSPLYSCVQEAERQFLAQPKYAFPAVEPEDCDFDLNSLYSSGSVAFAYTEAVCDGRLYLQAYAPIQVTVNGERMKRVEAGECAITCKKGDILLIKCLKKEGKWGFSVRERDGIGLPFIQMAQSRDLHFLFCGPFYSAGLGTRLAPEYQSSFCKPYQNENGKKVYWRFFPENTYLRAYLNSCFYGQWYYANMLCLYGLYLTAKTLDNEKYDTFFYGAMLQMAEFADYVQLDLERYGSAAFMTNSTNMTYLDYIGTMGANFAEAYFKSGNPAFMPVLERLKKGIDQVVSRFDDGTFCRRQVNTMWADDLYMSCPFLVRLAAYTGDDRYYDDAAAQIVGFAKRLYMPEEKLFSHIYFIREETPNRIPWGRGNGWIAYAMTEVLLHMPQEHKERKKILALYKEFMEGICACQDKSGLWHQNLNRMETYLETSCTAMFMLSLFRGVRMGWLDPAYSHAAQKAWEGLKTLCIDRDGVIYGICMGSGCSMEEKYYASLQTIADDDHGTGVVLAAINEMILAEKSANGEGAV